jgi:molecular chaperone GrpE
MPKDRPDHEPEKKVHKQEEGEQKPPELLTHPAYEEVLKKLDEAEQKSNQYWDRILRMQAESENVLRRHERDVSNAHKYSLEKFANELLPIVDSLELCLSSVPKEAEKVAQSILEGVKLTLKMFYTSLEKFGIKQVDPLGEAFDPEFQQAISMQYDPKAKPGIVISVLQKGYTLNDRLLRPALVIVSKAEDQ